VVTRQDTAIETKDFNAINRDITMEADETEFKIQIDVKYDEACTPDKDFHVTLMDMSGKRIKGDDTECKVTIIDTDNPGVIGFADRMMVVRPRDKIMELVINREKGADGEVTCEVNITTEGPLMPGKAAQEGKDFVLPNPCLVTFKAGESEHILRINMPGTSVEEDEVKIGLTEVQKAEAADSLTNMGDETKGEIDEAESVHFIVDISHATGGAKLSKKKSCFVEIRPQSQATDEAVQEE